MTDKPTPTDAELKAMWQLHAADIGGIFDFARDVLAKWGNQAQEDSVQEDAALSAIDEVLALFPFDATAQAFSIEGGPELKADGDTYFYSRNKVLTFLTKITTILDAARGCAKGGGENMRTAPTDALELLREIYADLVQGAIPNADDPWWQKASAALAGTPTQAQAGAVPLTDREIELIDGMIQVQLDHASRCDAIANRSMADKQKGWDMERVALLQKIKAHGIKGGQHGTE